MSNWYHMGGLVLQLVVRGAWLLVHETLCNRYLLCGCRISFHLAYLLVPPPNAMIWRCSGLFELFAI